MYHNEMEKIIEKVVKGDIDKNVLMEYLIDTCYDKMLVNITLEVRRSNTIAISLYKKYGFSEVGVRHNYYGNEDGLLMEKKVL